MILLKYHLIQITSILLEKLYGQVLYWNVLSNFCVIKSSLYQDIWRQKLWFRCSCKHDNLPSFLLTPLLEELSETQLRENVCFRKIYFLLACINLYNFVSVGFKIFIFPFEKSDI